MANSRYFAATGRKNLSTYKQEEIERLRDALQTIACGEVRSLQAAAELAREALENDD